MGRLRVRRNSRPRADGSALVGQWTTSRSLIHSLFGDRYRDHAIVIMMYKIMMGSSFYCVVIIYDLKRSHSILQFPAQRHVQHVKDFNNVIKGFRAPFFTISLALCGLCVCDSSSDIF